MPKLTILLRVKDGIFFLPEWLSCMEKIADNMIALDNGSTDGTCEMLKAHPKITEVLQTTGTDEGRDKNLLYNTARKHKADWLIWLDVDEIFEPNVTREHFDKLMGSKFITKYSFRRFHFIDREYFAGSWFRLNYSSGHDRIMWKDSPAGYFQNMILDCPNVKGIKGLVFGTTIRLKHLGYINKQIVDKKAGFYRSLVPEKESIIGKMYLDNEKPIKWIDDRSSIKVKSMNMLLSTLQVINLFKKAGRKAVKLTSQPF